MKPGDQKFLERWEKTRKQGRWRYVFFTGVLAWGVPMFVVMTFFARDTADLTAMSVAVAAVIWAIGGMTFGLLTWYFSERRYLKLAPQQPEIA